jgi:ABC-type Fe3+ transport system permease subunit
MTGRPTCIAGIVIGALLTVAPLIGFLVSGWHITGIFQILQHSGLNDPQLLRGHMRSVVIATLLGVPFCLIGLFILTLSLIFFFRDRNRKDRDRATARPG